MIDLSERHFLSRVEPSDCFVVGSWADEAELTCRECGLPIRHGERVAEVEYQVYMHEYCIDGRAEDERDA